MFMKCTAQVCTQKQKVGFLARPAGGAVEKIGRCFPPLQRDNDQKTKTTANDILAPLDTERL